MSRLAEIYKREKSSGGGLTSTLGKSALEKIDPRRIFDRSGVMTTMFPGLKSYRAVPEKTFQQKASAEVSPSLAMTGFDQVIETSRETAKNTLVLPSMARDMFLVKENILKLVAVTGQKGRTDWEAWKARQDARETAFEERIGKVGARSGSKKATRIIEEDKKSGAIGLGLDASSIASLMKPSFLMKLLTPLIGFLANPVVLATLGIGAIGAMIWKSIKSGLDEKSKMAEDLRSADQAAKVGGLPGAMKEQERIDKLPLYEQTMAKIESFQKNNNEGKVLNDVQLKQYREKGAEASRAVDDYLKKNAGKERATYSGPKTSPEETKTAPASTAPSPSTPDVTKPSKVSTASVPTVSGLPIDYKSYADKIGEKESSGDYQAVNKLGYLGKYQMGAMALQDAGLVKKGTSLKGLDDPSNWTIPGGKSAFLNNAELQEKVMAEYTKRNYATLQRIGVLNDQSSKEDVAGYLAASHLLGPGGAKALAQGNVGVDAFGTSSASYYKVGVATQAGGGATTLASASPSTPSRGGEVASASVAMAEGQRASMTPGSGGSTVIDNSSRTTVASAAPTRPSSTYDKDIVTALIGRSIA